MTLDQFVKKYNGKKLDTDGVPRNQPYQCVDLVKAYMNQCYGVPLGAYGNAKDYWYNTNPKILAKFKKLPYKKNSVPPKGSIVVWKGTLPGSQGYGHVDVFLKGSSSFTGFDQNWNGVYCHKQSHNYAYVAGFLVPKSKSTSKSSKVYYTVKKGDYLSKIANRFRQPLSRILKLNPRIKNPNVIEPKQKIRVK